MHICITFLSVVPIHYFLKSLEKKEIKKKIIMQITIVCITSVHVYYQPL